MSEFVLQNGQVIGERFRVIRPLARGGMSVVYLVQHIQLNSQHALKLLELKHKEVRSRMMQEGQVQSTLSHPNIVSVTDSFECEGRLALVMEYVEGHSLFTYLKEHGKLSLARVEELTHGLIDGLRYAHAQGLVHRDLKPANVLIQERDGRLIPKITDFGIVKVLDSFRDPEAMHNTNTGMSMGTPAYTAPEQADNPGSVTETADVFSLGCILYEMMCGQTAFVAKNAFGVRAKAAEAVFVDPRELVPGWPQRFYQVIDDSLAPDPLRRIPNIATFEQRLFGGSTSSVRPKSQAPTLILEPNSSTTNGDKDAAPAVPPPAPRTSVFTRVLFVLLFTAILVLLATLFSGFGCLAFLMRAV